MFFGYGICLALKLAFTFSFLYIFYLKGENDLGLGSMYSDSLIGLDCIALPCVHYRGAIGRVPQCGLSYSCTRHTHTYFVGGGGGYVHPFFYFGDYGCYFNISFNTYTYCMPSIVLRVDNKIYYIGNPFYGDIIERGLCGVGRPLFEYYVSNITDPLCDFRGYVSPGNALSDNICANYAMNKANDDYYYVGHYSPNCALSNSGCYDYALNDFDVYYVGYCISFSYYYLSEFVRCEYEYGRPPSPQIRPCFLSFFVTFSVFQIVCRGCVPWAGVEFLTCEEFFGCLASVCPPHEFKINLTYINSYNKLALHSNFTVCSSLFYVPPTPICCTSPRAPYPSLLSLILNVMQLL